MSWVSIRGLVLNVLVWMLSNKLEAEWLDMICKEKRVEKMKDYENKKSRNVMQTVVSEEEVASGH